MARNKSSKARASGSGSRPLGELPAWLAAGTGAVTLRVIVRPGTSRPGVLRIDPRGPVIGVAAAPERGKANAELVQTVARMAGVARAAVEVVSGAAARHKSLRISSEDPAATTAKLAALGRASLIPQKLGMTRILGEPPRRG